MDILATITQSIDTYGQFVKNFFFEYWLGWFMFIPVFSLMHFFVSTFEYRLNGGSLPAWQGYIEDLRFHTPGGWKHRVQFIKQHVFMISDDFQINPMYAYNKRAHSFALALKNNDEVTLKKMANIVGSNCQYWGSTIFCASLLTCVIPAVISVTPVVIVLMVLMAIYDKLKHKLSSN